MTLKGLHYLDKKLDIEMCDTGKYIESVEIDGKIIKGTNKLTSDLLGNKKHISIKVNRVKENPYTVYVKHANGLEFTVYSYIKGKLTTKLMGAGTSRIENCCGATSQ